MDDRVGSLFNHFAWSWTSETVYLFLELSSRASREAESSSKAGHESCMRAAMAEFFGSPIEYGNGFCWY